SAFSAGASNAISVPSGENDGYSAQRTAIARCTLGTGSSVTRSMPTSPATAIRVPSGDQARPPEPQRLRAVIVATSCAGPPLAGTTLIDEPAETKAILVPSGDHARLEGAPGPGGTSVARSPPPAATTCRELSLNVAWSNAICVPSGLKAGSPSKLPPFVPPSSVTRRASLPSA